MTKRLTIALVAVALFVLLAVMPVSAAFVSANLTEINQSATVFIGEQGLNLTHALNSAQMDAVDSGLNKNNDPDYDLTPINYTIGWWASAADIIKTAPSTKIDTTTRFKFFTIDKDLFVGYTGSWYLINSMTHTPLNKSDGSPIVVFSVADPRLDVAVWDFSQNKDVTGLSITQGQRLGISVKTNMVMIPTIDAMGPGSGRRGNANNAIEIGRAHV